MRWVVVLGTILGLTITDHINEIEKFLTQLSGRALFPRDVYYFKEIPTNVEPLSVMAVNLGAVAIATLFSLLPRGAPGSTRCGPRLNSAECGTRNAE